MSLKDSFYQVETKPVTKIQKQINKRPVPSKFKKVGKAFKKLRKYT